MVLVWLIIVTLISRDKFGQGSSAGYSKNNTRPMTQESERMNEVRHIGFLKVHKAASSTLQNIFYRFGLKRNLSFILPKKSHYLSKLKYFYNPIFPSFSANNVTPQNNKYDILCNHVVFNHDVISDLLHEDAVFIAIVREPFDLFLSAAYYYKYKWEFPYLVALENETFITDLIRYPDKYEAETMSESMTYNPMAYDFGLDFTNVAEGENITQEAFGDFLSKIGNIFRVVLLVEKFDESLILLKRHLMWRMEDIMYVKNNVYLSVDKNVADQASSVSDEDMLKFRVRNRFDYGIYNMFKERFEKQLSLEHKIDEETKNFQAAQRTVDQYCLNMKAGNAIDSHPLVINATIWNSAFTVSENDCNLLLMDELHFFDLMKSRQLTLGRHYGQ
ncbi:Galactose-3-O-sulfotransferase 3 [Mactra antiquata]